MDTVVFYHKNCTDGFCAAYLLNTIMGSNATYIPVAYGDVVPSDETILNKIVWVVDFSFSEETLRAWATLAKQVIVLDHHATASHIDQLIADQIVEGRFDMTQSGAGLTLDWLVDHGHDFPAEVVDLVAYVEDRDLWLWKLPDSRDVSAGLNSLERDFRVWANLPFMSELAIAGSHINRYRKQLIKEHVEDTVLTDSVTGDLVPYVVCSCSSLISEIGEALCVGYPYAIIASTNSKNGVKYSLRSNVANGVDVSLIAKRFGGGGHKNAAGFALNHQKV